MQLYKISEEILKIQKAIEEAEGEISADFVELFEQLQGDLTDKLDNCIKFIINENANALSVDSEIKRLKGIKEYHERESAKMKDNIDRILQRQGISEINTDVSRLSYRSSEGVVVTDDALILDEYKTTKTTTTTSLTLIGNAIKAGVAVDGAFLEKRKSLQIK